MNKLILLFFLTFLANWNYTFCQNTGHADLQESSNFYIHLNIPTIIVTPMETYDNNILQSYGLAAEYKFKNKFGISFNFTRDIRDIRYLNFDKRITFNSFIYSPSIRYYVDSNSKIFVNIGAVINSCNDKVIEENNIYKEIYIQNAITTGIGYKVYLFTKKKIGLEFFMGTKLFMWESKRNNSGRRTFLDDPFYFNSSVFYKF